VNYHQSKINTQHLHATFAVPDVICNFWHLGTLTLLGTRTLRAECQSARMSKITNDPVWHRMLYSCTHMATVGVKGLNPLHRARSPDSVEHFLKSAEYRAELFGGDTSKEPCQSRVEPVGWHVVGVWRHKQRQRLEEYRQHLGTRVVEHSTWDLRQLLHLRRTSTPSTLTLYHISLAILFHSLATTSTRWLPISPNPNSPKPLLNDIWYFFYPSFLTPYVY